MHVIGDVAMVGLRIRWIGSLTKSRWVETGPVGRVAEFGEVRVSMVQQGLELMF